MNPGPSELGSKWTAQTEEMKKFSRRADEHDTSSILSDRDEDRFEDMSSEHEEFFEAARTGNIGQMALVLDSLTDSQAKKDFINYQNEGNGCYAIQEAARYRQLETVKLLLDHGADIHMLTWHDRMTPFQW